MKRKTSLTERQTAAMKAVPQAEEALEEQILKRPDGYYWLAPDGRQEVGPFRTYEEALADAQAASGEAPEPGESLDEAESELGIAEWIDPDTGGPAEGLSPPHLDED